MYYFASHSHTKFAPYMFGNSVKYNYLMIGILLPLNNLEILINSCSCVLWNTFPTWAQINHHCQCGVQWNIHRTVFPGCNVCRPRKAKMFFELRLQGRGLRGLLLWQYEFIHIFESFWVDPPYSPQTHLSSVVRFHFGHSSEKIVVVAEYPGFPDSRILSAVAFTTSPPVDYSVLSTPWVLHWEKTTVALQKRTRKTSANADPWPRRAIAASSGMTNATALRPHWNY